MTINDILTQYEYFEYSREYLDLLKESYEIQFMEKYLEAQTFANDFSTYYPESTIASLSGYIVEASSNQTTTTSTNDKLNEKKEGFIRKVLNLFKKMIDTVVTFFKRIIDKFRKKSTNDIEDDLSKVSDDIAKEAAEKAVDGLDEVLNKYVDTIVASLSSIFQNKEVPNEQLLIDVKKELTKKGKIKRLEIPKTNLNALVVQQERSTHPLVQFAARNGLDLASAYRVFRASYMLTLLKKYENAVDLTTLGDMFRSIMECARRNSWLNVGETPEERAKIRSSQYDVVIRQGFDQFKKQRPEIQVLLILGSFPAYTEKSDYLLNNAFKQYTDYSVKLKEAIIQKDNNRTDLSGLHDMSIVIKMQNIVGDTIRLISEYLSHIGKADSKMSQYLKTNILSNR